MSKAVADSTVLIYLGKLQMLEMLEVEFSKIIVPEKVKQEAVDRGKEKGAKDAYRIEEMLEQEWVEVRKAEENSEIEEYNLEKGETAALSIAAEENFKLLADEENVREVARLHKLEPRGTLYFIFQALKKERINFDSYIRKLEQLSEAGFRISEEVYMKAIRKGKEISENRD